MKLSNFISEAIAWRHGFLSSRSLIGSDIIIAYVIVIHLGEAITLLITEKADWPIAIHSLHVVFQTDIIISIALLTASVAGAIGLWARNLHQGIRIALLILPWLLLLITSIGTLSAVALSRYPCADITCEHSQPMFWLGILWDQIQRLLLPGIYFAAIWARIQSDAFGPGNNN